MKMRSRSASWGICISISFHRIEGAAQQVTEPHGDHAENDRQQDVAAGVQPLTLANQRQRLQAERGESCVTAANARDEELRGEYARLRTHLALGGRQRAENSDNKRAGDV